jgi:hypothetical protein
MPDLPVVCAPTPAALNSRREGPLSDIVRTVDAERQCCRVSRFSITVEPDGGSISLDLTGPPGTREFISARFDE